MDTSLSDLIRQIPDSDPDVITELAEKAEQLEMIADALQEFIESYGHRGDFEDTIDYDTAEQYREYFGLSHERESFSELGYGSPADDEAE